MNLTIVYAGQSLLDEVFLLQAVSPEECSDISERFVLDPIRAHLMDHVVDAAHFSSPSRSATILSMPARSSAWWVTIRLIRALSSAMSMTSRVSSAST